MTEGAGRAVHRSVIDYVMAFLFLGVIAALIFSFGTKKVFFDVSIWNVVQLIFICTLMCKYGLLVSRPLLWIEGDYLKVHPSFYKTESIKLCNIRELSLNEPLNKFNVTATEVNKSNTLFIEFINGEVKPVVIYQLSKGLRQKLAAFAHLNNISFIQRIESREDIILQKKWDLF